MGTASTTATLRCPAARASSGGWARGGGGSGLPEAVSAVRRRGRTEPPGLPGALRVLELSSHSVSGSLLCPSQMQGSLWS